MFDSYKYMKIT